MKSLTGKSIDLPRCPFCGIGGLHKEEEARLCTEKQSSPSNKENDTNIIMCEEQDDYALCMQDLSPQEKDWEKKFDAKYLFKGIPGYELRHHQMCKDIKNFISQEKQKSYEEGGKDGCSIYYNCAITDAVGALPEEREKPIDGCWCNQGSCGCKFDDFNEALSQAKGNITKLKKE